MWWRTMVNLGPPSKPNRIKPNPDLGPNFARHYTLRKTGSDGKPYFDVRGRFDAKLTPRQRFQAWRARTWRTVFRWVTNKFFWGGNE